MFISKDKVFIHIPKTAGRSVTIALCDANGIEYDKRGVSVGYDHIPIHSKCSNVLDLMGEDYQNAFKFTIVRNPLDRLVSFYEYGNINFDYKFKSFDDFVVFLSNNDYRPEIDDNWNTARNTQTYYLDNTIDSIGKFEELDDYWSSLGYRVKLTKVNNTRHEHYTHYYNKQTEEIVRELYKEDFLNFYIDKL